MRHQLVYKSINTMQTPMKHLPEAATKLPQLKDLLGKIYALDYSENYEEFLRELGVKKNVRIKATNSKPNIVLTQENDEYILTTIYPEGRCVKLKFKPGQIINRRRSKCNATRSVFSVEDNKLIEEQWVDEKKVLIEREFRKKDLLVTMEVNSVKCYRFYEVAEESMHSIRTETSRRSFLWDAAMQDESKISDESKTTTIQKSTVNSEDEISEENLCY